MEFVLVLLLLCAAIAVIAWPLWTGMSVRENENADVAELEAAKEAKYREIRDAELDFRTGKLSEGDYRALDRSLRAEAVELLRRLDRARGG
ncbi:MAG TPA: hypothetical protein VHE14_01235 [Solirubrobacteraceae bacterium]|nr:hypothetical protein [Solirubrobacteraceae bacterium]